MISLIGGAGLLLAVAFKLSPEMQGFYYTFYSLTFLRFFAELGLTTAVVQFISHLSARKDQSIKLAAYTRFFVIWFGVAGSILALALMPAILLYDARIDGLTNGVQVVVLPWICLSITTGLSVFWVGLVSIVEGHRRILAVSRMRLTVSLANFIVAALLILLDFQLWSLPIASGLSICIGLISARRHIDILSWKLPKADLPSVRWISEIWPFQWRLGVSWLTGFFIFYFLTPFVMYSQGPEAAGQLGLSLQVVQIINGVAILAVSTHSSAFGSMVAKGEFRELDTRFGQSTRNSLILLVVLVSIFWLVFTLLPILGLQWLQDRLVPVPQLGLLTLASIGTHIFFLLNYYLRAFKDEALWWVSTANAAATLILSFAFIDSGGVVAAAAIFAFNSLFFWVILGPCVVAPRVQSLKSTI